MNVTDRRGERIGGIGWMRHFGKIKQGLDHELHLLLFSFTVASERPPASLPTEHIRKPAIRHS